MNEDIPKIGCVQHDCDACAKRAARGGEMMTQEQQKTLGLLALGYGMAGDSAGIRAAWGKLDTFVNDLLAQERAATVERCAAICDALAKTTSPVRGPQFAAAIRAQGGGNG